MAAFAVVGVCLGGMAASAQTPAAAGAAHASADAVDVLLDRVKASDPTVNFTELRRAYAESSRFTFGADDAEEAMLTAVIGGQHQTALAEARAILGRDYLNIEAHFAAMVSCAALDDAGCRTHHAYVARGLVQSILASGDGRSTATAFVVIRTPEEYALLRVLGAQPQAQALVQRDGHMYDVLTVQDMKTSETREIYFNIDIPHAVLRRALGDAAGRP